MKISDLDERSIGRKADVHRSVLVVPPITLQPPPFPFPPNPLPQLFHKNICTHYRVRADFSPLMMMRINISLSSLLLGPLSCVDKTTLDGLPLLVLLSFSFFLSLAEVDRPHTPAASIQDINIILRSSWACCFSRSSPLKLTHLQHLRKLSKLRLQ